MLDSSVETTYILKGGQTSQPRDHISEGSSLGIVIVRVTTRITILLLLTLTLCWAGWGHLMVYIRVAALAGGI